MTPNSIITFPPSGVISLQSEDTHSFRHSYFINEKAMETFHELLGTEFQPPFIGKSTADYSRTEGQNLGCSALYQQKPHMQWHQMQPMAYQYPRLDDSYEPSLGNDERYRSDVFIEEPNESFACDYTWPQSYESGLPLPTSIEPGCASACTVNSLHQNHVRRFTDLTGLDDAILDRPADLERSSLSYSPAMENSKISVMSSGFKGTPALVDTSSSKASDDGEGESGDGNLSTSEGRISDAPYAKLIYKALMEAPNHSMVLQDIYQWFIDNTGKGNSSSTGWRNSIRHNLSMNAAFRKKGQKANGDDSKRTSEWVLEPFAITEGVTPTTRYRKNGKKAYESRNLGPTRARSGRSGAIPIRKSKLQSRQPPDVRQDMANDQHQHRPMQHCTPPVMDQPDRSPYTPDCQQLLPGNLYHSASSFLDGWEQFTEFKPVPLDEGGLIYLDENEHYGDHYPCLWTNSQYY